MLKQVLKKHSGNSTDNLSLPCEAVHEERH